MARFTVSSRLSISNNSIDTLFLENPADSGFKVEIESINFAANGTGDIDVNHNVTESSEGTAQTVHEIGDTGTSAPFTVNEGGSYSGRASDPFIECMVPNNSVRIIGQFANLPVAIIPEGENMLFEYENTSGGQNTYSTVIIANVSSV